MVWVIAFGELFFGDLWCVVWGYGGMRTHFSLLNPYLLSMSGERSRQINKWRVSDCLCVGAWFTSTPRIGLGMPQLVG